MSTDTQNFTALTEENLDLFNSYKEAIYARIHETFPSIPNNYEFQPIEIYQQLGCGTTYTYKVTLPDNKLATVAFHLGGRRPTPLVGPPHFEVTQLD